MSALFHTVSVWAAVAAGGNTFGAAGEPERVTIKTSDDVRIVADYYAPTAGGGSAAPCAVLVHMYPADRQSWKPLAPRLRDAGFAVLAYDIRGAGESIEPTSQDLPKRYQSYDRKLFAAAWKDTAAALDWLARRKECDPKRVVLIGASVGSSIALQCAAQERHVRAVVCLSPGERHIGVDALGPMRRMRNRPVMLVAAQGEQAQAEAVARAGKNVTVDIRPGGRDHHGTWMFAASYGDELLNRIVEFVVKHREKPKDDEPEPAEGSGVDEDIP